MDLLCLKTVLALATPKALPCRHHASVRGQRISCLHYTKSKSSSRVPIFRAFSDHYDPATRIIAASSGTASRQGTSVSLRPQARPISPVRSNIIYGRCCTGAHTVAAAMASARLKRNSAPSRHMRCSTTPMRRANATVARFFPRDLATFHAQAVSQLALPRFNITVAALKRAARKPASPAFVIWPRTSRSPD